MFFYTFLPKILNMSITASVAIIYVLLLRLLLKKAPKVISYALWGVVLFRLLCPVSIESGLSLFGLLDTPTVDTSERTSTVEYIPSNIVHTEYPEVVLPVPGIGEAITEALPHGQEQLVADPLEAPMSIATYVWMGGILAMVIYGAVTYVRLRRRLITASPLRDNIYLADEINSPFVMGLIKPKIYLPSDMEEREQAYIILHEQHHIRRLDHIVKALAFSALCIHWFNPLVWVAFILSGKDMEMSCDEAVVRKLGPEIRADYTASLLSLATGKRIIAGMPLAFGEGNTKGRIKNLANWKKPAFGVVIVAVVVCAIIAVCLMTNPAAKNTTLMGANYSIEKVLYAVTVGDEESTEPPLQYCITADYHLYFQQAKGEDWNYLGALTPYELTNEELNEYMPVDVMRKDAKVSHITDAYILKVEDDNFYLVFQTKNGDTYLAYGWEDIGERGQAGSDDTRLRRLYLLGSSFYSGYVNVNFFQRSLIHAVDNSVYAFANFESEKIPGYTIVGFKSGDSNDHTEMTDMGFAVFQTNGEGYRLIDCHVYEDAVLSENGIYFCGDPAVADVNGEMRDDNTFDVILICNENVDKVERIYHADGKEDWVQSESYLNTHHMSLWPWSNSVGYTSASQYFYDKDGNLISASGIIFDESSDNAHENESVLWNGELIPGTTYVSYKCLYMNPLSSYAAVGGDSGCKYIVGEDYFATISRNDGCFVSVTHPNLDTTTSGLDGMQNMIDVSKWEWQEFPYTDEEWEALYWPGGFGGISNISEYYDEMLYQRLTPGKFLLKMDSSLWLVELASNEQMGTYLWSIYSLVPESAMGVAQWEYAPMLSSRCPYFRFEFDMDYTEISAVCIQSSLVDFDAPGTPSDAGLTVQEGNALYWSPIDEDGNVVTAAIIHFTVHQGDTTPYSGTIYIEGESGSDRRRIYNATIVGTGLHLDPNSEKEGGMISAIASPNVIQVVEHDLTTGDLVVSVEDLTNYVFYTNSEQISITVKGNDFEGQVNLLDVSQNNAQIQQSNVNIHDNDCLFTGLTSARLYRVDCEGLDGCTVVLSGHE